jgi:cellulose synthase/poly-beta-1,6-N-acetylglucosamine synthase-like glycosyltransferase
VTLPLAVAVVLGAGLLGLALWTDERRGAAPNLPSGVCSVVPTVTVLLPVRDEEHNVVPCLETLLNQSAAPLVRVIDDGSADATAALVAARMPAEPRLSLLAAGPLPGGWRGKLHALSVGMHGGPEAVATPWILSTDADTRHQPELLARSLAAAEKYQLDAVSVAGFQEARGLGENLLVPPVFAFLDSLLGDWQAAADSSGPPVANGQFLLLRCAAWEAAGGFAAIRGVLMDDVAVVRRLREHGGRTGFFRAPDLLQVRMYRGWAEAWRGWRRNLGALFGAAPRIVGAALAALILPPLALAVSLISGHWVEAALLWTAGAAASMVFRSGSNHAARWGLLYPLDSLALAATVASGVRDHRRGRLTRWKGREVPVHPL